MNALCIMTIYNEIDFLPYQVEWCRRNGLDLYIIDNYSTDYSYEWLKAHNISCHQVDTKEAFDLDALQKEIIKTTDRIKPDWVVYCGADMFIFAEKSIVNLCIDAEKMGKNIIGVPLVDMLNTGEKIKGNIFNTYFWYRGYHEKSFVYKWNIGIKYKGDKIKILDRNVYHPPGIMINYGKTKASEKRKELLKRRRLAWERGLNKRFGVHYLEEEKRGFKQWNKNELQDIRESQYWEYLKNYV